MSRPFTLESIHTVVAEITTYCNLHCPQCNRFDAEGHLSKELDLAHADVDAFTKNFDTNQFPNLNTVRFEGDRGDPVMHPDLDQFVEFFTGKKVEVVTNGSLKNTEWWTNLAKFKHLEVTFSVDGLANTNHLYRINSDFDKIMDNARAFIQAGGTAVWKFVVFKHNEHEIEQARALSQEMGFKDFIVQHTNRSWYHGDVWPVYVNGKFLHNIEPSTETVNTRGQTIQFKSIHERAKSIIKDNDIRIICEWARDNSIYIDYRLTVLPCCIMHKDSRSKGLNGQLLKKLMDGDFDKNSLYYHKMSDIINNRFFSDNLENSWNNNPFYHPTCVGACSG